MSVSPADVDHIFLFFLTQHGKAITAHLHDLAVNGEINNNNNMINSLGMIRCCIIISHSGLDNNFRTERFYSGIVLQTGHK